MKNKNFYRAFEDKFRGSRDLIKSRLEVYLPFVLPLKDIHRDCSILDLGCGRGEWLELMSENGFNAAGVDIDDGMLEACKELGLNAINKDALLALQELPGESMVVVSAFHIAEHLPFEILLEMVKEAKRVLKPAGILILETPNPANIYVGTNSFYFDPTHNRPIPSELLAFLPEFYGFTRIKILGLNEPELQQDSPVSIYDFYRNSSPDYTVIAQKNAKKKIMSAFESPFTKEFGSTTESLHEKFENALNGRFNQIESKTEEVEARTQAQAEEIRWLETRTKDAEEKARYIETKTLDLVNRVITTEYTLAETEKKVTILETELAESNAKFSSYEVKNQAQAEEIRWLETRIKDSETWAGKLKSALIETESERNRLAESLLNSENHLKTILRSSSWRIMSPYRSLGDFTKRIIGKKEGE